MRRFVLALLMSTGANFLGNCHYSPPAPPNGSTDGRVHTCGYVTEDGVTDHLAAYWARCGYHPDQEPLMQDNADPLQRDSEIARLRALEDDGILTIDEEDA